VANILLYKIHENIKRKMTNVLSSLEFVKYKLFVMSTTKIIIIPFVVPRFI